MENFFKNFFKLQYVNAVVTAVFDTLGLLTSNQRRRAGAPKKFSNHVKRQCSTIEEHGLPRQETNLLAPSGTNASLSPMGNTVVISNGRNNVKNSP